MMDSNQDDQKPLDAANTRYPDLKQSIFLLLQVLLWMMMFTTLSTTLIDPLLKRAFGLSVPTELVVSWLAFGIPIWYAVRRAGVPVLTTLPFRPFNLMLIPPMALTIIGCVLLLSELDNIVRVIIPVPLWMQAMFVDLFAGEGGFWRSLLVISVVAPITEELLFRGVILGGFRTHYDERKAIYYSSLMFAVLHMNPWQFSGALALGCLFAWWTLRSGSILPALFGHAFANSIPLLLMSIADLDVPGLTNASGAIEFQPLWLDAFGFLSAGIGMWVLANMFGDRGLIRSQWFQVGAPLFGAFVLTARIALPFVSPSAFVADPDLPFKMAAEMPEPTNDQTLDLLEKGVERDPHLVSEENWKKLSVSYAESNKMERGKAFYARLAQSQDERAAFRFRLEEHLLTTKRDDAAQDDSPFQPPIATDLVGRWAFAPSSAWMVKKMSRNFRRSEPVEAVLTGEWKPASRQTFEGYVNLNRELSGKAYVGVAATEIVSDAMYSAELRLGASDDVTVWLNGKEVLTQSEARVLQLDQYVAPIELDEGANQLVVLIRHLKGRGGFVVRVTDPDGRQLPNIAYRLPTELAAHESEPSD
ncbi:MAG: type II CAAX endopeptidase family protein [Candidatus Poribacteria bacterium]|nr:type II CAAX endopeptidase family protein [Candidatus Poribacteria bacterium]